MLASHQDGRKASVVPSNGFTDHLRTHHVDDIVTYWFSIVHYSRLASFSVSHYSRSPCYLSAEIIHRMSLFSPFPFPSNIFTLLRCVAEYRVSLFSFPHFVGCFRGAARENQCFGEHVVTSPSSVMKLGLTRRSRKIYFHHEARRSVETFAYQSNRR